MSATTAVSAWPEPSVRVEPSRLAPGIQGRIVVTLEVPRGCHVQSHTPKEPFLIPTTILLDDVDGLDVGPAIYPDGEADRFDWTPVELDVYRGTVEIVLPVAVGSPTRGGAATISGRLRYQGCTETACLRPVEQPIQAYVGVSSCSA